MFQPEFVCRVCLAEGTWNIFSTVAIHDGMCTVASINRMQEKLQYVTQLKLHENDGLPLGICELCIIQLNVAYRFKQLATETDSKLRLSHEARELSSAVPHALTNGEKDDVPENQPEPEVVMIKVEEFPEEISIDPIAIVEERTDSYSPVNNEIVPNPFHGMVCLQKDIINPAEDEAYLKDIINKEVIKIQWPKNNEKRINTQDSSTSPTIPPEHSKKQRKPGKSPRPHKRPKSETPEHGSENDSHASKAAVATSKPKKPKLKENQSTTPKQTPKRSSSSHSSISSPKKIKKSTNATLRKRRLQKVLNSLRIDMTFNNTVEWHNLKELQATPKMLMKRRNSVCVSSFAPWL